VFCVWRPHLDSFEPNNASGRIQRGLDREEKPADTPSMNRFGKNQIGQPRELGDMRHFNFMRFLLFLAMAFLLGCKAEPPTSRHQSVVEVAPRLITKDIPVVKICNFKDGHFTVDGKQSSLASLKTALSKCSKCHGVVWYYTDKVMEGEQVPQIYKDVRLAYIDSVLNGGLETRGSVSPDFSDVIKEQKDIRNLLDLQNKLFDSQNKP